jgi:hypothetical protein
MKLFGMILIGGGVVILTWCTIVFLVAIVMSRASDPGALEIAALIPAAAAGMIAAGILMRRSN